MLPNNKFCIAPKEIISALFSLYNQGQFDDILSRSELLIKEYPNTPNIHNILGAISFKRGDTEAALKYFRREIEINPCHSYAYNNLGAVLINLKKNKEAQTIIQESIKLQPNYAEAYNNLGNCFKEQKKYGQAIKNYKKVLELKPNYYEAYENLGIVLGKNNKNNQAEKVLKILIKKNPEYANAYKCLGVTLINLKKFEEAKKVIKKFIQIKPESDEGYNILGIVLTNSKKFEEAKKVLNHALKINPNNADVYFNLGNLYSSKKLSKIAIEYFEKALHFDPGNAETYYLLGINFTNIGYLKKGAENFKRCLKINSNHKTALHLYNSLSGYNSKRPSDEYIVGLFDFYAENFEKSLIDNLDYSVPKEIKHLLSKKSLGSILDLGCGTGLVGLELKNSLSYLEGVDLSKAMIGEAKKKKVYNKLVQSEITQYLKKQTLNFDYFIAADVFVYVGDLFEVFRLIKDRNTKSGNLIFSIEENLNNNYHLEKTGRYSHSKNYIKYLCKKLHFSVVYEKKINIRKGDNKYINGLLYNLKFKYS